MQDGIGIEVGAEVQEAVQEQVGDLSEGRLVGRPLRWPLQLETSSFLSLEVLGQPQRKVQAYSQEVGVDVEWELGAELLSPS